MNAGRKRHQWPLPHPGRPARPAPEVGAGRPTGAPADGAKGSAEVTRDQRIRALHQACYADLLRFTQRRLPGPEAEDVVASVFETAWVRLEDVPHDVQDARPWLFGVARNVMANHHRAAVRRNGLAVRLATTTTADADVHHGEQDAVGARLDLVRAWRTLAGADQEVLSLVAFDSLSGAQGAQVLGISRSAFAMRLQRARQRLAAALHAGDDADTADAAASHSGARTVDTDPVIAPDSGPVGTAPPADTSRRGTSAAAPAPSPPPPPPHPSMEMTWTRT